MKIPEDPKKLIKLEEEMFKYMGSDRVISSHELLKELESTEDSMFSIPVGVPSLDRLLGKFEAGELVVLTGLTGEGKTSLAMTMTQNMAASSVQTLWFTLEVTPRQFIKKIMGGSTDIKKLPLFYLPAKNDENTIDWIEKRVLEAQTKYNVKVVFIDHIHQIFSLDRMKHGNVSLELGDMVAKVKDMALRHNLVIVLIAHTKDPSDGSATREPSKESIRDSGLISRLADSIIAVWRVPSDKIVREELKTFTRRPIKEGDNWSKVRVLKNRRNGMLGTLIMRHNNHRLEELTDLDYSEPLVDDHSLDDFGF